MNLQSQDYLAKLLARENIEILRGNFNTASFDVSGRVLKLPLWADKGKAVNDLLIGHEVGHALYTPAEGWHDSDKIIPGVPRSMINIIEDIRIEKKIQDTYPGIVKAFTQGYKTLFDDNLFGTVGKDISTYGFMDRLNIHTKGRGYAAVEFTDEEQYYADQAMSCETWEDVLSTCKDINLWLLTKEEDKEEDESNAVSKEEDEDSNEECNSESDSNGGSGIVSEDEVEEETTNDDIDSQTDDAQRTNEKDLLETNSEGKQPAYCDGIPVDQIDKIVTKYKETRAQRQDKNKDRASYNNEDPYTCEPLADEFNAFVKDSKKIVAAMTREFERKKAAYEYSRSQTAKKGSLDVNKLHQYQYSEDIFQTVTKLAQVKSHGLVVVLDWSGSMSNIVTNVVKQTIQLAMFCKRVNIPFEVYSFTTYSQTPNNLDWSDMAVGSMDELNSLKIVELTNNTLNKSDFKQSLRDLFVTGRCMGYEQLPYEWNISRYDLAAVDRMGGTPLIETTVVMATVVKRFQMRNDIQNTNIIIMTDGQANAISLKTSDDGISADIDRNKMILNFKGKPVVGTSTKELYANCVTALKTYTNSTVMCLFLAGCNNEASSGYSIMTGEYRFSDKDRKSYKNDGIISRSDVNGFDEFTVVNVKSPKNDQTDEFIVSDRAVAIKDVKREFRKFSKTKKQTKKLVTTITDVLAA